MLLLLVRAENIRLSCKTKSLKHCRRNSIDKILFGINLADPLGKPL